MNFAFLTKTTQGWKLDIRTDQDISQGKEIARYQCKNKNEAIQIARRFNATRWNF